MSNLALVIEDDPDTAFIFSRAVADGGYTSKIITNGTAAMQHLQQVSPALVLLDIRLPGVSGEEILAYIRSTPRLVNTQVIIVTAQPCLAQDYNAQGEIAIAKPVLFSTLRDLIASIRQPHP